jgi:endosialidase-like protein
MAATKLSRSTLDNLFSDGERPTGENFASAWLSFIHQGEDGLSYDGKNLVISSTVGITLGNPTGGPGGVPGTLRFNGSNVQYYDPGANDFKDISGGAGAFLPVGAGPAVSYGGGNVGIGSFVAPGPTHRLEVQLSANTDAGQEVLFGNLVIHNGPLATPGAYIGNNALAANATGFALFQDSVGKTIINASNNLNSGLTLAINNVQRLFIGRDGNISLTPAASTAISGAVNIAGDVTIGSSLVDRTLTVFGVAQKTGGGAWASTSDRRVKKEIRPFNEGLEKLLLFDPVYYKFNGKGGTTDSGKDYIGLIAQDVQEVMPELVISQHIKLNAEDPEESDVLGHDLSPLTFMFINAIKELNERIEKLEKTKKNEKRKTSNSPGTNN